MTPPDTPSEAPHAAPASITRSLLHRLGYAGLLPFVGLAALLWLVKPELHRYLAWALTGYGALIAAFLGGLHWGVAFVRGGAVPRLHAVWGITPSLVAWVALMLPSTLALTLLAVLLLACYAVDHRTWPGLGLSDWLPLRRHLTLVAALCCLAGAAATWT